MARGSNGIEGLGAGNGRAARLAFLAAVFTSTLQATHAGTVSTYDYNDRVFASGRVCVVGNIALTEFSTDDCVFDSRTLRCSGSRAEYHRPPLLSWNGFRIVVGDRTPRCPYPRNVI